MPARSGVERLDPAVGERADRDEQPDEPEDDPHDRERRAVDRPRGAPAPTRPPRSTVGDGATERRGLGPPKCSDGQPYLTLAGPTEHRTSRGSSRCRLQQIGRGAIAHRTGLGPRRWPVAAATTSHGATTGDVGPDDDHRDRGAPTTADGDGDLRRPRRRQLRRVDRVGEDHADRDRRRSSPAPTAETLAAAKDAWLTARDDYVPTEAFRFYDGPIDNPDDGPEGQINAWPMDEAYVDYVADDARRRHRQQRGRLPGDHHRRARRARTKRAARRTSRPAGTRSSSCSGVRTRPPAARATVR